MRLRLPHSYYNTLSYIGSTIAIIATFMFVFLYVLSSLSSIDKAYIGIVIFLLIPTFIILGLLLIPIGMLLKMKKEKKQGMKIIDAFPILNLNNSRHRNATIIFALGTTVFLFLSALGSYEAYHYTESNKFCGTLCHSIMIPEYTAYQESPHARVKCAECHIGSGANWYVKSKLSGLYQVYATLANNYPRPIPTPVEDLRPARETCQECHWPQKIYGKQQRVEYYYLADEQNTRWEIDLLMNTGVGNPGLGNVSGIHWHINPDIEIKYITTDEKRLVIPRVILSNKATGEITIFNNMEEPLADTTGAVYTTRVMDCIDCHNRPSHIYNDPSRFINNAISAGRINAQIPMIKQIAVQACVGEYSSTPQALAKIDTIVTLFYADNYPEIASSMKAEIDSSITGIQYAFSKNIFPEMQVRWEFYPNHIGHMNSNGCFRCHDGKHASDDGKIITNDCVNCHFITAQGTVDNMESSNFNQSLEFKHPVDIDQAWRVVNCSECHATPPI